MHRGRSFLVFPLAALAAVMLFTSLSTAYADILTFESAINKASRQRMLTQRIMKSYLQVGLGAKPEESRQHLKQAVDLFEQQHAELKQFAPTTDIVNALQDVDALWQEFKKGVTSDVSKLTARRLEAIDEKLLEACEGVVYLIQDIADSDYARLVNTSGRQRMLSQRIAKFYMLRASEMMAPSGLAKLDRARDEFVGALQTLKTAPENVASIDEKLEEVEQQWLWLDSSLTMEKDTYYPLIVADASEKILRLMEIVTDAYARLGERQ